MLNRVEVFVFLIRMVKLSSFVHDIVAAPLQSDTKVIDYRFESDGIHQYNFNYELSDGQKRSENGVVKQIDNSDVFVVVVSGQYSFVGDDGVVYTVHYIADENGYHPSIIGPSNGTASTTIAPFGFSFSNVLLSAVG